MTLSTGLRLALIAQLAAGALLGLWLLPDTAARGWVLATALALPVLLLAGLLALELTVAAVADPRRPRTSPLALLRVWLAEIASSLRVFLWRQPFCAGFAEPILRHDPERPAVLLVHGYVCNRAVWLPLLRSGTLADCNVATLNLEPVYGPIENYAESIRAAVHRLRAATGAAQVTLVAHSMGGLVARAYLRAFGVAEVSHVITIATPHQGTVVGGLGIGRNAAQMAHGSDFLARLAASEAHPLAGRFTCIATADDNLVVPRSSQKLAGAASFDLDGIGHLRMVEDPRVWALLARLIRGT